MSVTAPAATPVEICPNGRYRCAGMGSVFASDRNGSRADNTLTADLNQICLIVHTLTRIGNELLTLSSDCLLAAVFSGVYQSGYTFGTT